MKFLTFLILAFAGFLIVAGIIFFIFAGTREEIPKYNTGTEKDQQATVQQKKKITTGEKNIGRDENKEKTLFKKALTSRNLEACEKINLEKLRDECWDSVLLAKALQETKTDYCEKIRNDHRKQYCHDQITYELAKLLKDYTKCDEIKSSSFLKKCIDAETKTKILSVNSLNDCTGIPREKDKKLCRDFFVAKKLKEQKKIKKKDCQKFEKEKNQKNCKLDVAIKKAEEVFDTTACRELKEKDDQKSCVKQVQFKLQQKESRIYMSTGNVEKCDTFSDTEMRIYCKDRALSVRALQDKSPFICGKIKNKEVQETCQERATNSANIHFYDKAKSERNDKWCPFILDEAIQKSCYQALVQKEEN